VLILDQAGWHVTPKLKLSDSITLMFRSPRLPELNPRRKRLAVHARQLALLALISLIAASTPFTSSGSRPGCLLSAAQRQYDPLFAPR
jgi:hypothetical protein